MLRIMFWPHEECHDSNLCSSRTAVSPNAYPAVPEIRRVSVERVEFLVQAIFRGFAGVDGTANDGLFRTSDSRGLATHERPPFCSVKNSIPLLWVPITRMVPGKGRRECSGSVMGCPFKLSDAINK